MAITNSRGYPGLVTASDYAILSRHQGQTYAVMAYNHYAATAGTGDRGVAISVGTAIGHGVMVENTGASVNLNADVMGSAGSRWDTVALERDWANKTSQLVILKGTSAKAISGSRLQNVGTGKDHQPLWLIRVENGKTAIQEFVDLRVWQQDSGLFAADPMARDYLNALGTDMLCKNGVRYIRVLDTTSGMPVWSEHRASPFGVRPYLMIGRDVPYGTDTPAGTFNVSAANRTATDGDAARHFTHAVGASSSAPAYIEAKTAGLYSINGRFAASSSAPMEGFATLRAVSGGWNRITDTQEIRSNPGPVTISLGDVTYLPAGARIGIGWRLYATSRIQNWYLWMNRLGD